MVPGSTLSARSPSIYWQKEVPVLPYTRVRQAPAIMLKTERNLRKGSLTSRMKRSQHVSPSRHCW